MLVIGEVFIIRALAKYLESGSLLASFGVSLLLLGSLVIGGLILSLVWTSQISALVISPLTSLFDGGNERLEPKPLYSIAEARRKQGKYLEAVMEIRKQLDRFPGDIEGTLLLASIQAENLQDLPGAEITLNRFCDRPDAPPGRVAAALNQLADWELRLALDVNSARGALEKIITRYPDTELALEAAQRIAHLSGTEEMLLAAHHRQPMAVPEGVKNLGLQESSVLPASLETDPAQLAAAYVKHLEQHPLDSEIRENLAVIYADHFQRLDLATRELEQLTEQPHQPVKRVVRWLNLLADLQVRHGADYDTVHGTLEKIQERFPDTASADWRGSAWIFCSVNSRGKRRFPV
jgi:tetratricopeptide (TPR) repeat protein